MPQIDKVTFLTTIYWLVAFYFFLYLDLNVIYLYKFITGMKLNLKCLTLIGNQILQTKELFENKFKSNFLEGISSRKLKITE